MNSTQAALCLPDGGGAIKGIGETFQANLFSGTANHSVPIALSPGRGGFGPSLSANYSSGHGNGIFGLGWQLAVPSITRKTEKGLPRYDDGDVFVLSGSEDLVPCLTRVVDLASGKVNWVPQEPIVRAEHTVFCYRPRTEGLFARVERWVHTHTGETHWRTISKDNVTSLFGSSAESRVADPVDDRRVYEWLLADTYDGLGNSSRYEYAADDAALYGDDRTLRLPEIFERHRLPANRYLRRIYYGNLPDPLLDESGHPIAYPDGEPIGHLRGGRRYAYEVVFDYGDWTTPTVLPHPKPPAEGEPELLGDDRLTSTTSRSAPVRTDRFSTFRAGFEIRTLRRCRRVLMFHHFAELGGPTLVRSTDFGYTTDADTEASLLTAVTVTGHDRDPDGTYRSASMPALTFSYTTFEPNRQHYQPLTASGGELPPLGLNQAGMALVDLFGDGLPDVLQSSPAGLRYWRNLGHGTLDRPHTLAEVPAGISLDQPGIGFGDMTGNGVADLLVHTGPLAGFFGTTLEGAWHTFTPYETSPGFAPQDPDVRMLDLTGDGRSDALMTRDEEFLWFACRGEQGFAPPRAIARSHDLDAFPDVFFDDPEGRVRLADMTGDGLSDIVQVHGGRVDYWPNLGYGRFGRRISMAHAPLMDVDIDPRRLFLVDLNGTGCADLVYVDSRRLHFWFNRSGNGWSERQTISGTPLASDATAVEFADVFGTGTATLIWSRDLGGPGESNYQALDFCGGVKPYVLVGLDNGMGATTQVSYAPSTRFFLEDLAAGTPWMTALPFPVQVVAKVEVVDHVGRTKRVSAYAYHHGHFDGREREFCGFGRVDQFDAESFDGEQPHQVPPVETRSWFHTGVYFDDRSSQPQDYRDLTARFRSEYYAGDTRAVPLEEHDVEAGETPAEAYRALRGAQLRTEVYAHDGTLKEDHPYQVSESRHRVTQVQARGPNQHAVYLGHQLETLTYHYERRPADPRISHALTLEVDSFGNLLRTLSVGYGRRRPDPALPTDADRERQGRTLVSYSETRHTAAIDDPLASPDAHRGPIPFETSSYELTGFTPVAPGAERFSYAEWVADDFARIRAAERIGYEDVTDPARAQLRLVEQSRTFFRADDLSDLLPLGVVEPLALPGESRRLAFTAGLVRRIYGERVDEATLVELGYVPGEDGTWWIPSGRTFLSPDAADPPAEELAYARQHFFITHRTRDPYGNTSTTRHDPYALLVIEAQDALANRTRADHDYRVMQVSRLTDANGNRAEAVFDTLGMVAGTALMGKATEAIGDSLAGFVADLTVEQRTAFLADPAAAATSLLGSATTRTVYDLDRYQRERQPVCAAVLSRETHASGQPPGSAPKVSLSLSYSDGFGRQVQQKIRTEPGPVVDGGPVVSPRWIGSGWTIFTNKGKPVQRFEPFFDDTAGFRFDRRVGVSSTLGYDPLERVVAILQPDHTWEKVTFDPWQQATWDVNDTVGIDKPHDDRDVGGFFAGLEPSAYLPTWHAARKGGDLGAAEQAAARKTAVHAETPTLVHADTLGRPFLTIAHNRFRYSDRPPADPPVEEFHRTRVGLDIEGNQREVIDAEDRVVMRYDYDMLGTLAYQSSMEAGQRWLLHDVTGRSSRAWDDRGHAFRTSYDALGRLLQSFVLGANPNHPDEELLTERHVYGEQHPDAEQRNLRGRPYLDLDQSGLVSIESYDFTGNPVRTTRRLARAYQAAVDWRIVEPALPAADPVDAAALDATLAPLLDPERYTSRSTYDALSRPVQLIAPHSDRPGAHVNVLQPVYNESGLLERLDVWLDHPAEPDGLLDPAEAPPAPVGFTAIDYDAKGQRTAISYANGVRTSYAYDPLTFRLRHLVTVRPAGEIQNLSYTYDPTGNLTSIRDDAQQTAFFRNVRVEPSSDYTYDAVYRLIEATGREHLGQAGAAPTPGSYNDVPRTGRPSPDEGDALGRYLERFGYDAAGNITQLTHRGSDPANPGWTRDYAYTEPSQLEPDRSSNRLSTTTTGATTETYSSGGTGYDAHGNLLRMQQLQGMAWDYRDQLAMSQRQAVNPDDGDGIEHQGERTYYVYDATGQRTRKVTERPNGTRKSERRYFAGLEVFRTYEVDGSSIRLERETLHVTDDNQRIALVETRTAGNDGSPARLIRNQFGNHLGSVSLELNELAQLVSYEEYYAYGGTAYQAGRSAVEVQRKRYRYSGKERDEETGLYYYGLRYYAPGLGRWINPDPAGLRDGLDLYRFARDNPVTLVDAVGTDSTAPPADKTSLLQDIEFVVERRHRDDSLNSILLGGDDLSKKIASAFITLGSTSLGCSNKVSTEDLFDRGAAIFAKDMHVERQLASAAARGDFERTQAPAAKFLYEEYGRVIRNGLAGPGIVPVEQTQAEHQVMEDARDRSRLNLVRNVSGVLAAGHARRGSATPGVENEPFAAINRRAAGVEPGRSGRDARLVATKSANAAVRDSVKNVNPTGSRQNCSMCVDAVRETLRGNPRQAGIGPMVPARLSGQKYPGLTPMSLPAVVAAMKAAGPGAQGVLVGQYQDASNPQSDGPWHAINVYNSNGTILFLDAHSAGGVAKTTVTSSAQVTLRLTNTYFAPFQ